MVRPHDLLWLADASTLTFEEPRPAWATAPWLAVAPVVVRRAMLSDPQLLPVGLRGAMRNERCAAQVPVEQVLRVKTPEDVAVAWWCRDRPEPQLLPCLQALTALAPALNDMPLEWGVTGSVGFTLASGFDVLREDSDLDLLVRTTSPADADLLHQVDDLIKDQTIRIDIQVQTPSGGFALREWTRTGGRVLLKTATGPVLCDDPWLATQRMIVA
jgi:phosphoribosyl-dephospho-CoA transferase